MSDLIDRDEAIDFIDAGRLCNPNEPRWSDNEVVNFLKSRPSAQPHWIPVTERLPEVRQWVLCQCRAGIMDVLRLTDDGCWYRKSDMIYMSGFVLAWMPLPEAYKGE